MSPAEFLEQFRSIIREGDIEELLNRPENIYFFDGQNLALFTYQRLGVYSGHYFFTERGASAKRLGREWLTRVFTEYPVIMLVGLTPVENRAARWMTRQLGFRSEGLLETPSGMCEFFLLARSDIIKDD